MITEKSTGTRLDIPHYIDQNFHKQGKLNHPVRYPSPFFDISKFYLPRSVEDLFKWCRYYYKAEGTIASVIYKLSEYPVTKIIYPEGNEHTKVKEMMTEQLKMASKLISIGLDYHTFGNCLITMNFPFQKFFKCPTCKGIHQKKEFTKWGKDIALKQYEFKGTCPTCGDEGVVFEVEDSPVTIKKDIRIVKHKPEHFKIKHNEITGKSIYYYKVPKTIKVEIEKNDEETIMDTPQLYLESLKENKHVRMNEDNVYHFKRLDVSDNHMGWGMPLIMPILTKLFHIQVLKKAQQAIAMEHLVPLRVLFPADNQSSAAPHRRGGLGTWKQKVEGEVRKWKRDPNYIPIMPVPLGSTTISGDGKMLLLTQEIKMTNEEVVTGMGVPQEFAFGGLSWSGSSISLRMLENHFLVYREMLHDFLNNFVIKKLAQFLEKDSFEVTMREFKMADDVQKKQMLHQLKESNDVSKKTFLQEVVGINYEEERKQMIKELKEDKELNELIGEKQGVVQAKVQELITKAQIRAQAKASEQKPKEEPVDREGYWKDLVGEIENQEAVEQAQEETGEPHMNADFEEMATHWAQEIIGMEQEQGQMVLAKMKKEMPEMFDVVVNNLKEMQQQPEQQPEQQPKQQPTEDPLPEKLPPRREGGGGVQ